MQNQNADNVSVETPTIRPHPNFSAERFREARKKTGLSQAEAARRLGLASRAVLNNWELGRWEPPFGAIIAACELFGVSAEQMCGEARQVLSPAV